MIILEEQTGLNAGLNKGLKIGKFIKRNVQSAKRDISIKNAVKIGKKIAPLATTALSFMPATAPIGIASKLAKGKKLGKIVKGVKKVAGSRVGRFAINKIAKPVFNTAVSNFQASPNTPMTSQSPQELETMPNATVTPAQLQTIAEVKGVEQETLSNVPQSNDSPSQAQLETLSQMKDIPVDNLKEESQTQKEIAMGDNPNIDATKSNYTIPIVIGVGVLGAVLLASKSKSN